MRGTKRVTDERLSGLGLMKLGTRQLFARPAKKLGRLTHLPAKKVGRCTRERGQSGNRVGRMELNARLKILTCWVLVK
ncbi:MAG TPA: hypothetical protein GXX51_03545 [Firmicutes bacterium]|nr:hypothetical protein [Bacillota bacterium]